MALGLPTLTGMNTTKNETPKHTRSAAFEPADYRVEAIMDQHEEDGFLDILTPDLIDPQDNGRNKFGDVPSDAFADEMNAVEYRCAHCGRRHNMRHIAYVRHLPTGALLIFGHQCMYEALATSREQLNEAMTGKAAEIRRKRLEWEDANPEQAAALDIYEEEVAADPETADDFLSDLVKARRLYGALTEAQTNWPTTAMVSRLERIERRAAKAAEMAEVPALTEGRYEVTGKVISLKVVDGYMPGQDVLKMLVEMEDGNRVFGTVPSSLYDGHKLPGRRVTFTAKVERSSEDEHFGFYSRPTKATVEAPASEGSN